VKIEKKKIPARPAQKGVKNPFTGEFARSPGQAGFLQAEGFVRCAD